MFGRVCKVCQEKDARIKDLLAEVAYLRQLASPAQLTVQIPAVHAEADQIISGGGNSPEYPQEQLDEIDHIDSEAHALLTGSY